MDSVNVSQMSTVVSQTGAITFNFTSGQRTFENLEELRAWAGTIVSEELAEKIIASRTLAESPDGANLSNQDGAQVSINKLASIPVVYTPAE